MKLYLPVFLFLFFSSLVSAQEFRGQWKGQFIDKSAAFPEWSGDKCDYVLELETNGNKVSGYSYTYFSEGGKKYYTICKLEGFIDRKSKYIEVKETERTKTNVPVNIRNCFQTHKLTYFKKGDTEILEGDWIPAPKQDGDCGYGLTTLTRRVLKTNLPIAKASIGRTTTPVKKQGQATTQVPKNTTATVKTVPKSKPAIVPKPIDKKDVVINESKDLPLPELSNPIREKSNIPVMELMKRNLNVLKTIKVNNETIRVDLYDNGEIDGDSVSLFYNKKLIVSKKRLTDKPLTFYISVDDDIDMNELVMYAENLGSIPPNTALMVVTDGVKRYEVRITSDLQKSGVIQFIHEK